MKNPLLRTAWFRFYAELNDFIAPDRRFTTFSHEWIDQTTVKDMIEGFGVPHTEVDLILVNGASVSFDYVVRDADRISVYPMFEAVDIGPVQRVRPEPLRTTRFVADVHLGRLTAYLRLLGFDTAYSNCMTDEDLARISASDRRVLLTRDVGLLKRSAVTHGYFVRATQAREQAVEVMTRFDLARVLDPFSRCVHCNTPLEAVNGAEISGRVPERVAQVFDEFRECTSCRRVFWKGSHYQRVCEWIASLQERAG